MAQQLMIKHTFGNLVNSLTDMGCVSVMDVAGLTFEFVQEALPPGKLHDLKRGEFNEMVEEAKSLAEEAKLAARLAKFHLIGLEGMLHNFGIFSLDALSGCDLNFLPQRPEFTDLTEQERSSLTELLREVGNHQGMKICSMAAALPPPPRPSSQSTIS